MPLELSVWRINDHIEKMEFEPLDFESRLQDILANDITIADANLMVIGREVPTGFEKRIDLLAMNPDGELVILELKRHKTSRDIVAQVLDYGSWVRTLADEEIAKIFTGYQKKYTPNDSELSLDEAFQKAFKLKEMPDEINESHQLVIVASSLDASTERIVQYLADEYSVNINAIFFRVFKDGDKEYLTRAWLREPGNASVVKETTQQGEWNGEYYVSFGTDEKKDWEEARKYGFISAGGKAWYSNSLQMLSPGDRIWVNIPSTGYVGVGIVEQEVLPIDDFEVLDENGEKKNIRNVAPKASRHYTLEEHGEKAEYLVRVKWIKTVSESKAIKEKGFFGNQNSAARPKTAKWEHTVGRLKVRFGVA